MKKKKSTGRPPKATKELTKEEKALIKQLGKAATERRIELGYTSHETFAADHEIVRTQYNQWETGKNLQFLNLIRLIRALKMKPSEFMARYFDKFFEK